MTTTKSASTKAKLAQKKASKRAPKELHDSIKDFRFNRANKRNYGHFGVPA